MKSIGIIKNSSFKEFIGSYSPILLFTLLVYLVGFFYLFIENFIFSQSVDLLNFREVDDFAFQCYLRSAHENLQLLRLNGYNYGWIFWFPLVILTYPFYFLSIHFNIDMPLIALPRQLSLFYTMGTGYILYKIASVYTKDEFLKAGILLLFLSFPATGYFALRFGTVGQTSFFCALTYFLAIRKPCLTPKNCYGVALSMALAIGTKLSSILIAPLIICIVIDRFNGQFNKKNIRTFLKSFIVFFLSFIALSQLSIKGVLSQIALTQTNLGSYHGFYSSLSNGVINPNLFMGIFYILLIGLVLHFLLNKDNKKCYYRNDFLYGIVTLLIAIIYLVLKIKLGAFYITIYFTAISFLMPLGILSLEKFSNKVKNFLITLIVSINFICQYDNLFSNHSISWSSYYLKVKDPKMKGVLSLQSTLKKKIGLPKNYKNTFTILKESQVPSPYSGLRKNVSEAFSFNNMHLAAGTKKYNLIGVYKMGLSFLETEGFQGEIRNLNELVRKQYIEHRKFIHNLLKTKELNGMQYTVLLENEEYLYLQSIPHSEQGMEGECQR